MFSEELNIVQSMWDDLGVTEGFRMLFEGIARELEESLRKEFIDFEIGALKKFSDNLMVNLFFIKKLSKEIQNREKTIQLMQQFNETIEKEGFNENYIQDLVQCIKNIRIMSVNIVNYFIKIREICSYHILGGKFDLDRLNKVYQYDRNYLIKMKYDLEFLKESCLNNYFNFSGEADPFLISAAQQDGDKYVVQINEDMLSAIKNSQFLIMQDMIFYHLNIDNSPKNLPKPKPRYVYSSRGSNSPPKSFTRPRTTLHALVNMSKYFLMKKILARLIQGYSFKVIKR
jgi:hypothetical protein